MPLVPPLVFKAVRLRICLQFSNSDLGIAPEGVRHLDATVATLPNQALVRVALVLVRLVFRIEPPLMSQYLWSPGGVQIGRAAIAITKEGG